MPEYYPPVGFHFSVSVQLDGLGENDTRFQEISGLSAELSTEDVVEGGENRFVHRLPVRAKYSNLVLKRGMLTESGLIGWFRDAVENFLFKPADVLVTLLNEAHEPLAKWSFKRAWPVKWTVSDFKAQDNALVVETIELVYQYFRRM